MSTHSIPRATARAESIRTTGISPHWTWLVRGLALGFVVPFVLTDVLELNRRALAELRVEKRLEIVPGASHHFEEPGALEEVSRLAREWFERHLIAARTRAA